MSNWKHIVATASCLILGACDNTDGTVKADLEPSNSKRIQNDDNLIARVDDVPIIASDIRALTDIEDGGVERDAALRILIRNQLLAGEATRRGYGNFTTVSETRKASMARALLKKKIGTDVDKDTVDNQRLRQIYDANKGHFVHGVLRRVNHIVVLGEQKGQPSFDAEALAREIARDARETKFEIEDDFLSFGESVGKTHGKKIKLEKIPPFESTSSQFARPFVKAAFDLPRVGSISPIVKTEFGFHIIYLAEEIPKKNQSFEEVRDSLAEEWLPNERKLMADKLIQRLYDSQEIFIYEDVVRNMDLSK